MQYFPYHTVKLELDRYMCNVPVSANPSCRHATLASVVLQRSSQTVPQALLLQTSTRPSYTAPPTSRISPGLQIAVGDVHKNQHMSLSDSHTVCGAMPHTHTHTHTRTWCCRDYWGETCHTSIFQVNAVMASNGICWTVN